MIRTKKSYQADVEYIDSNVERVAYPAVPYDMIRLAGALLNPTDRLVLKLAATCGYSLHEVARTLGISESSVHYRMKRLTKKLNPAHSDSMRLSARFGADLRKAVSMAILGGQSYKQIALQTGLSVYRTKKLLSLFKKTLAASAARKTKTHHPY